jgi:hypothetical protein
VVEEAQKKYMPETEAVNVPLLGSKLPPVLVMTFHGLRMRSLPPVKLADRLAWNAMAWVVTPVTANLNLKLNFLFQAFTANELYCKC